MARISDLLIVISGEKPLSGERGSVKGLPAGELYRRDGLSRMRVSSFDQMNLQRAARGDVGGDGDAGRRIATTMRGVICATGTDLREFLYFSLGV